MLQLFVRRGLFECDDAEAMLAWPRPAHPNPEVVVPGEPEEFEILP